MKRWLSAWCILLCVSCGDDVGPARESLPAANVPSAPAESQAPTRWECRDNVAYDLTGLPHRDCSVIGERCSCNPGDNSGYFSCACVPIASKFSAEDRDLWYLDHDWNLHLVARAGKPAVRALIKDSSRKFRYEIINGFLHAQIFSQALGKVVDVGLLTMDGLCQGLYAQNCAVRLESAPYSAYPAHKIPTLLVVSIYDEMGRLAEEISLPAGNG